MPDKFFINPYNFISSDFTEKIEGSKDKGNLTGVIHCRLITKTPTAIPDVEKREQTEVEDHFYYPFYQQDGKYMIPGSSLRGPIRSMYETLTDSCYVTTDVETPITYRSAKAFEAGLLRKTAYGWKLYQADRCIFSVSGRGYKPFNRKEGLKSVPAKDLAGLDGKEVSFDLFVAPNGSYEEYSKSHGKYFVGYCVKDFSLDTTKFNETGYICIGEKFGSKHFESIFWPSEDHYGKWIEVSLKNLDRAVDSLQTILDTYNNESINKSAKEHRFYPNRNYKSAKEGDIFPIWYMVDDSENAHLSVADIGRSAYTNTMKDLLKKKAPCTNRNHVCKACALFGMTGNDDDGSNAALGSKVRISDAKYSSENDPKTTSVVLRELAGPKPSYLPFYLDKKIEDNNWSDGYDAAGAKIRGRKFYWHNEKDYYKAFTDINGNPIKLERNATMELMPKECEFSFDVFFDEISNSQLNELLWTLTLGENQSDGTHCYKVGHGKSIGLGSAKIVVNSVHQRTFDSDAYTVKHWTEKEITESINSAKFGNVKKDVLIATDLSTTRGKNVEYPKVVDKEGNVYFESIEKYNGENKAKNSYASHQYFRENYKLGAESPKTVLPKISDNNLKLRHLEKTELNIVPGRSGGQETKNNNKNPQQRKSGNIQTGRIKFFNQEKKFGFIYLDDKKEIHFFESSFNPEDRSLLKSNTRVEFTIETQRNGKTTARNCRVIK